jgi:hypothetical protein
MAREKVTPSAVVRVWARACPVIYMMAMATPYYYGNSGLDYAVFFALAALVGIMHPSARMALPMSALAIFAAANWAIFDVLHHVE